MLPVKCRVCLSEALSAIISPLVWSCERAAKHRYILLAVNCCSIACRRGCSSQAASDCGWAMLPSGSVKISPWMTNGAAPSTELFFEIADFELVELGTAIAQLLFQHQLTVYVDFQAADLTSKQDFSNPAKGSICLSLAAMDGSSLAFCPKHCKSCRGCGRT